MNRREHADKSITGKLSSGGIGSVVIDGQTVAIAHADKNLIDVADRAGITIPCACYRSGKSAGCCRACLVLINGRRRYACATIPTDGMTVIVSRKDLKSIRRQRIAEYRAARCTGSKGCCCPDATGCET
ncbi:MAG: (2Fe-2S)-binding protein [Lentisphaerae bacterium]|nr:(2Fe-2S)-binding protein [Lentisphaerota bacterium]